MQPQSTQNHGIFPVFTPQKRGKRSDNHPQKTVALQTLLGTTSVIIDFMRATNIRFVAFKDLMVAVGYYVNNGVAVSRWDLYKLSNSRDQSYQSTYKRIDLLVSKGLLEFTAGKCVVPTRKALKELSELVK